MAIKLKKTPSSAVGTTSDGLTSIYFGTDGILRVRRGTTDTKILNLDGTPIRLEEASTTPVAGYVRVQGKEYGGVTELAATTPSGVVRITRGATVAVPNGGFYTQSQKARQSWDPIPVNSSLTQGTGLTITPPAGQWVLYPCRLEYVAATTLTDSLTACLIITTNILFDDSVGTPADRFQPNLIPLGAGIVAETTLTIFAAQPTVDAGGEIFTSLLNTDLTNVGWAESVFSVGPPAILSGAP